MFIFYEPETFKINHVVLHAPPNYAEFLQSVPDQHWVEADFQGGIDEMELMPDLTVKRRIPINPVYPAHMNVGVETIISNVPQGVSITINHNSYGMMDSSETIEFTPETGGNYTFVLEGSGYIKKEFTIEALS